MKLLLPRSSSRPLAIRSCLAAILLIVGMALPIAPVRAQVKPVPSTTAEAGGQGGAIATREGNEREGAEFLKRRQRWFYQQRAYPLGYIPQGARARALDQLRRMQNVQRLAQGLPPLPARTAPAAGSATTSSSGGQVTIISGNTGGGFVVPPSGTGAAWLPIGPQATSSIFNAPYTSGRVTAIASDPRDLTGKTLYMGGADGGVWKTTDGGVSWTALFDYQPLVSIGSIVVDPVTNPSTVYVGTGEDNYGGDNVYGAGVYKSIDGGSTWSRDSTFGTPSPLDDTRQGPMVGTLAVDRASGHNNILLAGVRGRGRALQSGVWCSSDSGSTWTVIFPVLQPADTAGDPPTGIVFDSTGVAYVALGFPFGETRNGIYKSSAPVTSCSITFNIQNLGSNFASSSLGRIALAIAPSSDATLYAAIAKSSGSSSDLLGVIKTTNGGSSWTQLTGSTLLTTNGFCNSQCFFDLVLAVHPTDPNTVFAGGSAKNATLIRSTDGGSTWSEISRAAYSDGLHVDMHAIAFAQTSSTPTFSLYAGNDGGIWSSGANDPKASVGSGYWTNLNGPLNITQMYPGVSIHPSTPLFALGGAQDNGVQVYNGNLVWTDSGLGCDGGMTAIDPQTPTTSYSECEYLPDPNGILLINIAYTGDGMFGNGFVGTTGITSTDRGDFIPPLILDKNNPLTLYFGTCRVWQTKDGANSWNAISPDLTSPSHPAGCGTAATAVLKAIAVAPTASSTIYTGADDGEVEVTTNGGTAWTSLDSTGVLPNRTVTQIAVDPTNSKKAYVTFSGFGSCNNVVLACDQKGHVFVVADATAPTPSWSDISGAYGTAGALPDIPVNDIVIDPDDATHNTLYVATDIGAFFTTTGGVPWALLGAANTLPNSEILSLTLHNPSRTLRAGTHGRGVWDLNLGPAANTPAFQISSISPVMATHGASDIVNFTVNGTGFQSGATINFKLGSTTTVLTPTSTTLPTQLVATLPAAQLAAQGVAQVSVTNPGPTTSTAVPFVVLGPDYVIVSTGATSATVNAGGSASFPVSIAALNGFNSSVTMSCSVPALGTTCMVTTPLAVNGAGKVSVTTTALLPPVDLRPPAAPGLPLTAFPAALVFAALLFGILAISGRKQRLRFALTAACAVLLLLAILPLAGCGSGGSSAPPTSTNRTPAGTYTVTVTGTSGSITHTTPFTLIVQ